MTHVGICSLLFWNQTYSFKNLKHHYYNNCFLCIHVCFLSSLSNMCIESFHCDNRSGNEYCLNDTQVKFFFQYLDEVVRTLKNLLAWEYVIFYLKWDLWWYTFSLLFLTKWKFGEYHSFFTQTICLLIRSKFILHLW